MKRLCWRLLVFDLGVLGKFAESLSHEVTALRLSAVCVSGRAAISSKTGRWIKCRLDEQCPPDFTCQNGSCCTGQRTKKVAADFADQACPRGTRAALRENGGLTFCDSLNPCPEDAFCRVSATSADDGEGICCAGHLLEFQSPRCPGNGSRPLTAGKYQSVSCSLGQQMGCSPPYTCAYASINATDGLCCMVPSEGVICPPGMERVVMADGHHHQQCSPLHLTTCPEGGACVFNEAYGIYYCCRPIPRDCPEGRRPFVDPYTNQALDCTANCPPGFTCLDSPGSAGKKACCSEHSLVKHCLVGKALTNNDGVPYSCSSEARCPPGYYCLPTVIEGNVCCPKSEHVCSLSADFGSACTPGLELVSFYFDATYKACKPFLYRGCGGNDNRFVDADQCDAYCHLSALCQHGQPATAENGAMNRRSDGTLSCQNGSGCPDGYTCSTTSYNQSYCCPAPEAVCKQPKSSGLPCDDVIRDVHEYPRVWYFDIGSKKCQPMTYYGCDGNANRFNSLEACEKFCYPIVCPTGGTPWSNEQGVQRCEKDVQCHSGYHCMAPLANTGGISVCCPAPETMCSNGIDKGETCGVAQLRYGFNQTSGVCEPFTYLGCKGNDNNFDTTDSCKKTCASSIARATIPAVCPDYPGSDQPKRCRTADDCPVMHQCTFPDQKALGLGYCCPMPKQKCLTQPPLWHSQKYPSNDECSVHIPNACPLNYSCQLAEAGFKKCCLDPDISQVCPASTLRGKVGQHVLTRCDESDDQCAPGYSCTYSRQFGQFFCCLSVEQQTRSVGPWRPGEGLLCPGGTSPYVDPYLHTVRVCSPYLRFSCPTSYECIYNPRAARYQCCLLEEPAVSGKEWAYRLACPTGQTPYFQSDDRPVICQPTSPSGNACPIPSVCQYSPLYWQFICCIADGETVLIGGRPNATSAPGGQSTAFPSGRTSCTSDLECQIFPGTVCRDAMCKCPRVTLHYACVDECPPNYIRTPDDRCQQPMFDFHYYRQVANRRRYYSGRRRYS